MGSRWADAAGGTLLLAVFLTAARPAAAQRVTELGVVAIGTAADPGLLVGGITGALRTSLRTRVAAVVGAGGSAGDLAWRGELLAHFLLAPTRRDGAGVYGAGGVAVVGGPVSQGYLVLAIGLEGRPGARAGWFVEAGVGGGARLALGYRWRRLPAAWPGE